MKRQEIFDQIDEIVENCVNSNIGTNETELDIKESVTDWIVKNLNLPVVSNQRELLIAAAKGIYPHGDQKKLADLIDKYLSNL